MERKVYIIREINIKLTPKKSIGGFKGEAQDAPSKTNQKMKLELLRNEGVLFNDKGKLMEETRWWADFKA